MPKALLTILGKAVQHAARLRGGGSALPGLVVERIDPNFIRKTLATLPIGTVVISGTNGKTTTTKMVVELLEGQGLKVFTNRTGSNFTRGVAAALLSEVNIRGNLSADIAVLELDEAHAVHFVDHIAPNYCLLLNVMRDQLDRFGEIDNTANLLQHIAQKTKKAVVLNREDYRIANISRHLTNQEITFFGLSPNLKSAFPNDDNLHGGSHTSEVRNAATAILQDITDDNATFMFNGKTMQVQLKLNGVYNIFNAAAALALVNVIVGKKLDESKLFKTLANVTPAFGRGEKLNIDGKPLELVLVKNPSGFQLALNSFDPSHYATMIAINDNYADGRDMSWLWDVDFTSLADLGVSQVSGIRAYDMALRLRYDAVPIDGVNINLKTALKRFIRQNTDKPKRIYCTYTAMLAIRRQLSKNNEVEVIK